MSRRLNRLLNPGKKKYIIFAVILDVTFSEMTSKILQRKWNMQEKWI